jgi:hypothetical protein
VVLVYGMICDSKKEAGYIREDIPPVCLKRWLYTLALKQVYKRSIPQLS